MSKQRQKGTAFETLIVDYLREHGFPQASRSPLHGAKDTGDTMNTWPFVLEMKNHNSMSLGAWLDEAAKEFFNAQNTRPFYYAVIHKRRGRGWAGHQFVTMDLQTFTEMAAWVIQHFREVSA